jgi:15-cis-phytoene synthase
MATSEWAPDESETGGHGPRPARRLAVSARATWRATASLLPRPARQEAPDTLLNHHARTFAFAARWLPPDRRRAAVVLYAFCRTLDDLVDEPAAGRDPRAALAELAAWRAWFAAGQAAPAPREPLGRSLAAVQAAYAIPEDCLLELIDGLAADALPRELRDAEQLHRYCHAMAGTVGIAMAHVLGASSARAIAAAEALGIAMQLTNILRDVAEDLARDRLYLPLDELTRAGSSRAHLTNLLRAGHGPDDLFRAVMRRQVARAYAWYDQGLAGIDLLPLECQLPIRIAGRLYRRILTVIERHDYDVLRHRAATTKAEKAWEAWQALTYGWRQRDSSPAAGAVALAERERADS